MTQYFAADDLPSSMVKTVAPGRHYYDREPLPALTKALDSRSHEARNDRTASLNSLRLFRVGEVRRIRKDDTVGSRDLGLNEMRLSRAW